MIERTGVPFVKAHAYGNDFLLVRRAAVDAFADRAALARAVCDRHRGLGADGLMIVEPNQVGADTTLLNADGSPSEVSGNGVRCAAAWLASERRTAAGETIVIGTGAGEKRLTLLSAEDRRWTFRAEMGPPDQLREEVLDVHGASVRAVVLRVGNPQCVVLGDVTEERLRTIAAALAVHPFFPEGTNVELARVAAPDRVEILIWERGVGPTDASGTGACAAAVAAAAYGGAARRVRVVSPGGAQEVEWTDRGLLLTGWAELLAAVDWWPPSRTVTTR
ncbi:MAG TPA: diaminopimelate epimerase [Vicinamibacterales bacterium]|nr:diaminopimelate epimerase [Vicinamibacterales bacterium]